MATINYRKMISEKIGQHLCDSILNHYGMTCQINQIERVYTNPRTDDILVTMKDGRKHRWILGRTGWQKEDV